MRRFKRYLNILQKACASSRNGAANSNANTLFGMERFPFANHIRQTLDGVPFEQFDDVFIAMVRNLDRKSALRRMRHLWDRTLIAFDGHQTFSTTITCNNCSTRLNHGAKIKKIPS
ncbi:MAG: hypothetical protein OXH65_07160 [Paracoccaceae bacterium]|nr:hypothetical protein [Paracoccaceae bacterium]MDE2674871.1 hypothetical protein [Paracoccaceae bacterium]